jgi:hypothetical protein
MKSGIVVSVIAATVGLAAGATAQTSPCNTTRTGAYYRTDCQAQGPKSHSTFEHYGFIDPKPTGSDPSMQLKPYGNWNSNFGGVGAGQAR